MSLKPVVIPEVCFFHVKPSELVMIVPTFPSIATNELFP
jgi:hypothetical protein